MMLVIEITVGIVLAAVLLDNLDIILPIVGLIGMDICAYMVRDAGIHDVDR
jgi:hypothetical protein